MSLILRAVNVNKTFKAVVDVHALKNINLDIEKGDFVVITGPSGSGKTTLLYLLGALDRPTEGEIYLNDMNLAMSDDKKLSDIRAKNIGFIFQFHFLLPEFSAMENVVIPQLIAGIGKKAAMGRAKELLIEMGLEKRINNRPGQLSGGEQQRVAIARAMANNPLILLADEPTGNLDMENTRYIYSLFEKLNKDHNQTIVLVTHEVENVQGSDKLVKIVDGEIIDIKK